MASPTSHNEAKTPKNAALGDISIPYSKEAEEAVLSAIMIEPNAILEVDSILKSAMDFFLLSNRIIYLAMQRIVARKDELDPITLADELERTRELEKIGGHSRLTSLYSNLGTSIHASVYAQLVARAALRRRMLEATDKMRRLALDEKLNIDEVRGQADSAWLAVTSDIAQDSGAWIADVMSELYDDIESAMQNKRTIAGFPTGLREVDLLTNGFGEGQLIIIAGRPAMGKCFERGTPIMMADGSIKPVEAIGVGELVMGQDSQPRKVLNLSTGYGMLYRVTPAKGMSYVVNENHILSLRMNDNTGYSKRGEITNVSISDYLQKSAHWRHHAKGYRASLDFDECPVAIDPYLLGLWLGDGASAKPAITTADSEIVDYIYEQANKMSLHVRIESNGSAALTYHLTNGIGQWAKNDMVHALHDYKLFKNKHIPSDYKLNSRRVRLEVLAGLIDTDGYLVSNCYELITVSKQLADDYLWLARSLGFAAYVKPSRKTIKSLDFEGMYWRLFVSGDIDQIPVRIARKKAKPRLMNKNVTNVGITVEAIGGGEYFGFEVDGDHLFLLGDFTVTHNSAAMDNIALSNAKAGTPIFYATSERTKKEVCLRMAAIESGVNSIRLSTGKITAQEAAKFTEAVGLISNLPIYFDDAPMPRPRDIYAQADWMIKRHDCKMVLFDGMYRAKTGDEMTDKNEHKKYGTIALELKTMARALRVPVITTHQLSRDVEKRQDKRPIMSDLRESGRIEEEADKIIFLYRDEVYNQATEFPNACQWILAKHRNGAIGTVSTYYEKTITKFLDATVHKVDLSNLDTPYHD